MIGVASLAVAASMAVVQSGTDVLEATEGQIIPVVVTNPSWKSPPTPTPEDYPTFAAHLGLAGRVTLECQVSTNGTPRCEADSATPQNLGFKEAAVKIAERGQLHPRTVDGQAVEAQIRLSVPFTPIIEGHNPSTWTGPEPTAANLLAGMVAAQSLARSPAAAGQIDWGLHQLPTDHAQAIEAWIAEMYIGRTHIGLLSRSIAMVLAKRGAQVMPATQPADWNEWVREMDQALSSIYTPDINFAPLKARYCARYGCGTETGSTGG